MEWNLTSILAVWGSSLATLTFAWNVSKWLRDRPRLAVRVEKYENPWGEGILFEIKNRGEKPTTIEEIMLVTYSADIWGMLRLFPSRTSYMGVKYPDDVKLPVVLGYGEMWSGRTSPEVDKERDSPLDRMDQPDLIAKGKLFYKIRCAHTDRLLSGKVKPENFMRI